MTHVSWWLLLGVWVAVVAACSDPLDFDVDAGPDAFWASCGDRHAGDTLIESAEDVDDLAGITVVNGDLVISGETLEDVRGLASLRCVRGRVDIGANPRLTSLDGLESLVAIEDDLDVQTNALLTSIEGLRGLRFVGPFSTSSPVSIFGNPILPDLRGLERLSEIHGDLDVAANGALVDLTGLESVTAVAGDVTISRNPTLRTTEGLTRLATVGHRLRIESNDALETVALPALVVVDEAPSDVTGIFRGLIVSMNRDLERVELPALTRVEDLDVSDNPALAVVDLHSLASVTADTRLTGNLTIWGDALSSVDLTGLESVDADFYVGGEQLESLSVPRLGRVGGDLNVGDASVFDRTIAATVRTLELESLATVGGDVVLVHTALPALSGLRNLASIEGDLVILENELLRELGLDGLSALGGELEVRSNLALPTCEAEALEAQLRDAGFTGRASFAANDDAGTCP